MLPPTEATASVSLGEKPVPHSCREKMLGTRVCFTRESKKGSRLSSGWWEKKAEAGQGCVSAVPSPGALCTQGNSPQQHCCAPGDKQGQGKRQLKRFGADIQDCQPTLTRAISAYASPRIPSQLEPLMKNLSDSVMAAMLALTVTLGPWGMVTRSVPSSPSHLPWV